MKRMGSRKKSLQSNNSDINNIYQASDYMTLSKAKGSRHVYGDVIAGLATDNKRRRSMSRSSNKIPKKPSPFRMNSLEYYRHTCDHLEAELQNLKENTLGGNVRLENNSLKE